MKFNKIIVSNILSTKVLRYLIGQNFRRTKFFGGQNFRHQVEISAVLSDEMFSSVSYFPTQFTRKICFNMIIALI